MCKGQRSHPCAHSALTHLRSFHQLGTLQPFGLFSAPQTGQCLRAEAHPTHSSSSCGDGIARGSITHLSRCEASLCAVGSVLCSCLRARSLANSPWQSCTPGREKQKVRHSPCAGMICTCPGLTAPGAGVGLCSGAGVCLCSPCSVWTHTSPSQLFFRNCPHKVLSPYPAPPDCPLRCSDLWWCPVHMKTLVMEGFASLKATFAMLWGASQGL